MSIDAYLRPINHSETLLINERSDQLAASRQVYRFGFGQSPFPVPAGVTELLRLHAQEKAYLPVQGLRSLREAVAGFHRQQDAVDWQPERVLVISDEIYGMLHHQGAHRSLARYYPEGTLVTGGLSKWCGAGGWRLGVLHVPQTLADNLLPRLLGVASETWSCVAAPIQQAAVEAYRFGPEVEAYVQRERQILSALGRQAAALLNEAGVLTAQPEGGFYLFPDFAPWREALAAAGITTSDQLCGRLLQEAGVALLPGTAFGMPEDELVARLSYVNFDGAAALQADEAELAQILQPVLDGLAAITSWLREGGRAVA